MQKYCDLIVDSTYNLEFIFSNYKTMNSFFNLPNQNIFVSISDHRFLSISCFCKSVIRTLDKQQKIFLGYVRIFNSPVGQKA